MIEVRRYRYDMNRATNAGETRHPQLVIRELAPSAFDFEPVTIGDCWLFTSSPLELEKLPAYVEDLGQTPLLPGEAWRFSPPVDVVVRCPGCGRQHLDVGEFETRVHRKHLAFDRCDVSGSLHAQAWSRRRPCSVWPGLRDRARPMIGKRGYSWGAEFPYHCENRHDGWAVFDARTDVDVETGLSEWRAFQLAEEKNKCGAPDPAVLAALDETP